MPDQLPEPTPNEDQPQSESEYGELEQDVLQRLQQNRKIAAVKLVREHLNCSLKEAKEAVETVARKHNLSEGSTRIGCTGMILLALLVPTSAACYKWFSF